MANARTWFIGVGCLVVLLVALLIGVVAVGMRTPSLPGKMVLAMEVDGPIAEVAVDDPIAELMGETATSLRDIRRVLLAAADDDRVKGVRIRLDGFSAGAAQLQEIRELLQEVRAADKWTAVYTDTFGEFAPGNFSYYLATACDEISINPLGDVNLIGLSIRSPFIRGMFDKLGIEPEFPGRGAYKTARFMYTEKDFTPEQREMMQWLVGSLFDQMVEGIAEGRGMEPEHVKALVDDGPYVGRQAIDAGLVDHMEDWTAFRNRLDEREGGGVEVVSAGRYLGRLKSSSSGTKIGVVTAVGGIMRGESRREFNPILGASNVMGSETIARAFRKLRDTPGIKAVVFRVDSPGGSAIASEVIRQEMARTAEEIPVVVSMGNVAGSGGYWISCGAQRIVADPMTITGSIGVLTGHLNTSEFWREKLGITFGRMDFGRNANFFGDLESWNDAQRAVVDTFLDRIYDAFLTRVAEARGMTVDEVDAIGRGRVFTGVQAVENGLVDSLGGFGAAVDEARELAGIEADAKVRLVDFPRPKPWWKQFLNRSKDSDIRLRLLALAKLAWGVGVPPVPGTASMMPVMIE